MTYFHTPMGFGPNIVMALLIKKVAFFHLSPKSSSSTTSRELRQKKLRMSLLWWNLQLFSNKFFQDINTL